MSSIKLDSPEVKYLAERDFRLRHLMRHIGDLEYGRPESAFHSLAHSIIEQMLSMKAGRTIEKRLIERCGGELSPDALIALPLEEIRACGVSSRKAANLKTLSEYAVANDLEKLAELDDATVSATLQALPGIGKWTCDMFLLFYLERPDILPVEDGAVRQVFEWLYGAPITNPEVRQAICSLWSPFSSTAIRYIYRALNTGLLREGIGPESLWSNELMT